MAQTIQPAPSCPCRRVKCPRHGDCEACRAHHASRHRALPACDRQARRAAAAMRGADGREPAHE